MNISFVVAKNYESRHRVCKQPPVAIFATNGCQCRFRTHHLHTFKMARKTSGGHATSYIKARTFFCCFAVIKRWFLQLITVIYEILVLFPVLQTNQKLVHSLMLYHQN